MLLVRLKVLDLVSFVIFMLILTKTVFIPELKLLFIVNLKGTDREIFIF